MLCLSGSREYVSCIQDTEGNQKESKTTKRAIKIIFDMCDTFKSSISPKKYNNSVSHTSLQRAAMANLNSLEDSSVQKRTKEYVGADN